jgi:hypothetical protein
VIGLCGLSPPSREEVKTAVEQNYVTEWWYLQCEQECVGDGLVSPVNKKGMWAVKGLEPSKSPPTTQSPRLQNSTVIGLDLAVFATALSVTVRSNRVV